MYNHVHGENFANSGVLWGVWCMADLSCFTLKCHKMSRFFRARTSSPEKRWLCTKSHIHIQSRLLEDMQHWDQGCTLVWEAIRWYRCATQVKITHFQGVLTLILTLTLTLTLQTCMWSFLPIGTLLNIMHAGFHSKATRDCPLYGNECVACNSSRL